MKKFILNTNLVDVVRPDTYGTFNAEFFDREDCNEIFTVESYDYDEVKRSLKEQTKKVWQLVEITEALDAIGVKFADADEFYSPREYNYGTDSIDLEFVVFNSRRFKQFLSDMLTDRDAAEYMHDNYRSYPGYINMMPESVSEIISRLKEDPNDERAFAAAVMLALNHHIGDLSHIREEFCMAVLSDCNPLHAEPMLPEEWVKFYESENIGLAMANISAEQPFEQLWHREEIEIDSDANVPNNDAAKFILWAYNKGLTLEYLKQRAVA